MQIFDKCATSDNSGHTATLCSAKMLGFALHFAYPQNVNQKNLQSTAQQSKSSSLHFLSFFSSEEPPFQNFLL
jgi:hypothetical protein